MIPGADVGILFRTAKGEVENRVVRLNAGNDDHLTKRFSFDELFAQVNVLVRCRYDKLNPMFEDGNLRINTASKQVTRTLTAT